MSPTGSENSVHKNIYQEDYLLSLNMMMGNMQFNDIGMLQKHSSKPGDFEEPTLANGNENITSASRLAVKANDNDDSNANFETELACQSASGARTHNLTLLGS